MMQIKAANPCNQKEYLIDNDECVLLTAVTDIAVRNCIQIKNYDKVLLPFIISTGDHAELYVTGLNKTGAPAVYTVRYPDGTNSRRNDLSSSPCEDRTKLFIAFAVLLNNFKDSLKPLSNKNKQNNSKIVSSH